MDIVRIVIVLLIYHRHKSKDTTIFLLWNVVPNTYAMSNDHYISVPLSGTFWTI
jgi:hypothetical protein